MTRAPSFRAATALACASLLLLFAVACGEDDPPRQSGAAGFAGGTSSGGVGGNAGAVITAGDPNVAGSVNEAGAAGSGTPPVAKERIGDQVFNEAEIQSYYLTFSDAEYAKLMDLSTLLLDRTTVNEDRYVEASLRVGDTELPSIAVRFKGQFSIWGCVDQASGERKVRVEPFFGDIDVCQRFSLKLDFNEYDEHARLDGLKKLNLHAMAADPSKMRERLGYSLYRDMDLLAPRAVHARVYINGEYHGLFAAVEEVDGRFAANRFPKSGDGNLYKEIWPAAHVTGDDAKAALKTNDDPATADVSDFLSFKAAVLEATEADFATKLGPHLDFDYLARFLIVNRAINDFDGVLAFYYGWGPPPANHNLYWYHDSESGQFTLIPWDLDKAFWYPEPNFWSDNAPNGKNITPNWNVITDSCNGYTAWFDNLGQSYKMMAIDCDPLLKLLRGQVYQKQKAMTEAFIAGPFSEASIKAKLEAWRAQVGGAVEDDPLLDRAHWQSSVDALLADIPKLQNNVSLMMSGLIPE
jgi:CotH protein